MKKIILQFLAVSLLLTTAPELSSQEYKIRQSSSLMGMKMESTVYVKGMRKRTESGAMMGMSQPITIEQCDLQRTIKINDKKKLYFIDSFYKMKEEIIDEDEPAAKKPTPPVKEKTPQKAVEKGGVITIYYSIRDTGERKKMYGLTARHVWTTQKMKPSADACMMKDSFLIKTDGWYIDLPKFNCPVRYRPQQMQRQPDEKPMPDCQDRFVTRRSGKGKLGFPLIETTTMIMGAQGAKTTEFKTDIETLDFSMQKLDSMLFEIPLGYTETKNEDDLMDKMDMSGMLEDVMNKAKKQMKEKPVSDEKAPDMIRVGVLPPKGDEQVQPADLQTILVGTFTTGNIEAVAVSSAEEAKTMKCDYLLNSELSKIKSGSKVGGLLKAIKNTDPNALSSFTIEGSMQLTKLADGSNAGTQKIDGKYEGKVNEAAGKALDNSGQKLVQKIQ
jgi:hypothetical protein